MSEILKAIEDWFEQDLYQSIIQNFDASGTPKTIWGGGGSQLLLKSKRLANSWLGSSSDSVTKRTITDNKVIFERYTKVPYARLHEYGGEIPVTPNMRRYFWMLYFQHKGTELGDASRRVALFGSVLKFPSRTYLRPAIQKAIEKLREKIGEGLRYEILKDFKDEK